MRNQRPKQADWIKPFKLIQKKQDFNKLDGSENQNNYKNQLDKKKQQKSESKKEDIAVPRISQVTRNNRIANEGGIPLHYTRLRLELNLPKADKYELNEVDFTFLIANENQYLYGGRKVLTVDFLQKAFVELQLMAGKQSSILPKNNKTRLKALIQRQFTFMFKMDNFEAFLDLIYNHWRSRREQLKTPLLRVLWKPNADDNSHFLAFRPRDREKMRLRRINKPNDEQTRLNMENLRREFMEAKDIAQRVKSRQELKLCLFSLEIQKFNNSISGFRDQKLFFPQINRKQIQKHRQSLTKLNGDFQNNKNITIPEEIVYDTVVQDQKQSVINFLSTLIHKSAQYQIDYDLLMGTKQAQPPKQKIVQSDQTVNQIQKVPNNLGRTAPPKQQLLNYCNFNIKIVEENKESLIQRNFNDQVQKKFWRKSPNQNNFFSQRHKRICENYFFEEDQDEGKDIKRSISINFKKFLTQKKELII